MLHICGASKGKYGKPILLKDSGITKFTDPDTLKEYKIPQKLRCESSKHEGRKVWFLWQEMYIQKWELTEEELERAEEEYDIFSLDMPPLILCSGCMKRWEQNNEEGE